MAGTVHSLENPQLVEQVEQEAAQAARQLKDSLTAHDALCGERQGGITLYASDITGDFGALAPQFLREPAPQVLEVDIDKY